MGTLHYGGGKAGVIRLKGDTNPASTAGPHSARAGIVALAGIALTTSTYFGNTWTAQRTSRRAFVIGHKLSDRKYPGGWGYAGPILIGFERDFRACRKPCLAPSS